jgi:hypothetical protein
MTQHIETYSICTTHVVQHMNKTQYEKIDLLIALFDELLDPQGVPVEGRDTGLKVPA